MVGDGREIQRPIEFYGASGLVVFIVWLNSQWIALGETIGIGGFIARVLAVGVERPGRVDMKVAKMGSAQWVIVAARVAVFSDAVGFVGIDGCRAV